jgi:hypothetical protein
MRAQDPGDVGAFRLADAVPGAVRAWVATTKYGRALRSSSVSVKAARNARAASARITLLARSSRAKQNMA